MCVSIEASSGSTRLIIQVSSAFRLEDARQIDSILAKAVPGVDVDVDFREVHECEGPALAHLVDAIRSGRARIALHGMSGHVRRLLEYLGAQLDSRGASTTGQS
jgi:anti-anti-sigma regulatory factor